MSSPPPSHLDANQVLKHAFCEDTGELRVKANITPGGGDIDIDHTEDSVALGDGTNLLTSTTVGSDIGLDVNLINSSLDMDIVHTDDSVALGDGTNLLTSTTIGSDIALDVNVINSVAATPTTPTVTNIAIPLSATEVSHTFPISTTKFIIQARGNAKIQFSFVVSTSGTNYITLYPGSTLEENTSLSASLTIYFQSNKAGEILEILSWD